MIISATEDIGLANPNALLLANTCFEVVQKIGLPEGRIPMAQCAVYLSESPKSNRSYAAINKAMEVVQQTGNLPIPLHLRNAPTKLMKELGYGEGYIYTHEQNVGEDYHYLPKDIVNLTFLKPK
jgi:putative ATPase